MQNSRRSFLFGRGQGRADPWRRFVDELRLACLGRVDVIDATAKPAAAREGAAGLAQPNQARLAPARAQDVHAARSLCATHGVRLALAGGVGQGERGVAAAGETGSDGVMLTAEAGSDGAAQQADAPTLWVDPSVALTALEPLAGHPRAWRAEAGCLVAELQAAGFRQFDAAPAGQTLAAWLSDRRCASATGRGSDSGVLSLRVMLADGTRAELGPFGANDRQPLRGATLHALVPRLFELAHGEDAEHCLALPRWPVPGRLDALRPPSPAGVNLAHLLLGQAGTLAWIEEAVLEPAADIALQHPADVADAAASRIHARCKALFDPHGLFPPLPRRSS